MDGHRESEAVDSQCRPLQHIEDYKRQAEFHHGPVAADDCSRSAYNNNFLKSDKGKHSGCGNQGLMSIRNRDAAIKITQLTGGD